MDVGFSKRLQDVPHFRGDHREVPVHDRFWVASDKGRPRVDAHRVADVLPPHRGRPAKRELVDPFVHLSGRPKNSINFFGVER